jgi:hypothetical protein
MNVNNTFWENEQNKITLLELLNISYHLPEKNISLKLLKSHLLSWKDVEEISKIKLVDLQYPILILVDDKEQILSILDGHHRTHKAISLGLKTIKAKLIAINFLPAEFKNIFSPTA